MALAMEPADPYLSVMHGLWCPLFLQVGEPVNLYLPTRPEVKVTSDKEVELIWAGPAVLHTEGAVIRVQFALVLLTATHFIQRELFHTFLAVVAIQQDLYQLVHRCAV